METIEQIAKKLMDAKGAADHIGITKAALLRRVESGDIECAVFPGFCLFLRSDVEAFKRKRDKRLKKEARERAKREKG